MQLGAMQDWPLRVMRLIDHAEREHGDGEIVTRLGRRNASPAPTGATSPTTRGAWRRRSKRLGIKPGDRVATLAMNHEPSSDRLVRRDRAWAACSTPSTRACSTTSSTISPTMPRTGSCSTTAPSRRSSSG